MLMEKKDWDLTGEVREIAKKAQLHEVCTKEPWSLLETTESVWFLLSAHHSGRTARGKKNCRMIVRLTGKEEDS